MVVYKHLQFPKVQNRPYFFANFVSTLDGKVAVKGNDAYQPIGSINDFDTFINLRTYADALIHGKTTAKHHRTIETKMENTFLATRKKQGKPPMLPYFIVSNQPDMSLLPALINNSGEKPYIVTSQKAVVPKQIEELTTILRFGKEIVDLSLLADYLFQHEYTQVLVEGGPTLLYSFLKQNLLDELFLTVAPKIFAGEKDLLTLVEGPLFSLNEIKQAKLLSVETVENEVFLRYQLTNT